MNCISSNCEPNNPFLPEAAAVKAKITTYLFPKDQRMNPKGNINISPIQGGNQGRPPLCPGSKEWRRLWIAEELSPSHPSAVFSDDSAPETSQLFLGGKHQEG